MVISYFQTLTLQPDKNQETGAKIRKEFVEHAVPLLLQWPQVKCVSIFAPGQSNDPYVNDDEMPDLVIQLTLLELTILGRLFENATIWKPLSTSSTKTLSYDVFEVISFEPLKDGGVSHRIAPISYNVRYFPPVEDIDRFVSYYLDNHVPILKDLPDIRNVLCYLPILWDHPARIEKSGCILGNEVIFDSFKSLDKALASDVRHRLREDYNMFPVKPGPNTHCAMYREDFR